MISDLRIQRIAEEVPIKKYLISTSIECKVSSTKVSVSNGNVSILFSCPIRISMLRTVDCFFFMEKDKASERSGRVAGL